MFAHRRLRWPWSPPPGMTRISNREYIRLLTESRRATILKQERDEAESETAAIRFLVDLPEAGPTPAIVRPLTEDPPVHRSGALHEEAFQALVGHRVAEKRFLEQIENWSAS